MHPGQNVGLGKDYTLYALTEGVVVFERRAQKQHVKVVPFEVRPPRPACCICVPGEPSSLGVMLTGSRAPAERVASAGTD